jgi:hypothetical protein
MPTFPNTFEASFPVKHKSIHTNKNGRITQGIKISCGHKYTAGRIMMQ